MGIAAADAARSDSEVPWASWRIVTKDYFKTLGLPLLLGRAFTEQDQLANPLRVVIGKRLADLLWPGQDPVGRTALLWKGQGDTKAEVVGVVGDMRERGLESAPTLAVYLPAYGSLDATTLELVMHTRGAPEQFVPQLRAIVSGIDSTLPVSGVTSLEEIVDGTVATRRFTMTLLFTFAAVAVMLALAGVYGIVAYSVSKRTPEIGVRLALGATPGAVLTLLLRQAMRPVGAGIILGLCGTWWLSSFVAGLLFGIEAHDPATYAASLVFLAAIALLACYFPARRAMRVDPAIALRVE
jgi:putative ABC transport system permease protein